MFLVKNAHDIYISRGEAVSIGVNLISKDEYGQTDYDMTDEEYVEFKLWDKDFRKIIKSIKSEVGSSIIELPPEFTIMRCEDYCYSVDLIFADGRKETIIGKSPNTVPKFKIMEA